MPKLSIFNAARSLLVVATISATFTPATTHASILFGPAIRYQTLKTTDQTSFAGGTHDQQVIAADGHLGILIEGTPLYIGGMYTYESTTSDSTDKMVGNNYGPTVGLFSGAFSLLGTYIMKGERTYTTSLNVENKLTNGLGFRVDVSYVAGFMSNMGIGPQITYRSIKYAKSQAGAALPGDNTFEETSIDPALVFWFRF